ncbi:MAG: hypothetical protein A2W98_01620 [Bacteroidetes bacterium GWF2_33_38]|nr:MAG: hypothetical protein A2W98_01620 [Bacteroidetes bacterium GWF2_33_38]OFY85858.1 MAG: hypothetical protein A2236_03580 [Bacteroidetes bacterium RIFOXYA2_FULL_33_7]
MNVSTWGQATLPHHDPINYTIGQSLSSQSGWTVSNTGDSLLIASGNLSNAGLPTSTGNKVTFDGAGIDAAKLFTQQTTGTVYYSFLMNVTALGSLNATGGYFTAFTEGTSTTFGATVWTRLNGAGYDIGISPKTSATTDIAWSTSSYAVNTTILVVVSYEFVTGTANDVVRVFVNPTPGASEPAATITATNAGGTDLTNVNRILIRQDSSTETPSIEMDELRVGTSWADVTPVGVTNPVTSITVTSANDSTTISTAGGTLQMSASVLPVNADISTVTWTVIEGTGFANISETGLLTAVLNGTVTARATADDGSGVYGEKTITLNNQNPPVLVSSITVTGAAGVDTITTYHGTLQMSAEILPVDATDATFTWSVTNGTGTATISSTGLLTAATDGVVTVVATANDGSGVTGSLDVTLSNQVIPVTTIYDIQYTTASAGDSPLVGQLVTVTGIVTGLHYNYAGGTYRGYFIQDAVGAWNGVYVYSSANTPTVGDEVTLTATVSEYNGLTELTGVTNYTLNSSGNTLPTATVHSTGDLAKEPYEGVLIRAQFAECTTAPTTYNDFTVNDGTGDLNVDDDIFEFTPTVGSIYDVTGIGHFGYGLFKILPRSVADVTVAALNTEAEIVSFVLAEQVSDATITSGAATVSIEVFAGTDVTALVPTIGISAGADIIPNSGVAQNFTNDVTYTVTAQDGSTKTWTVSVNVSSTQNSEANIVSFDFAIDVQAADEVVNATDSTVAVGVFADVNLTNLTPTITLSAGATINPASGTARDFTSPVTYTVTAQDGSTTIWTVTVTKQTITTIFAIQNSTGNSPLNNQVVTTTGTVCAVKDYNSSSGLDMGYFLQSGTGEFTGIYVESPNLFAIGDSVYVTGKVTEDYNFTIINTVTSSKLTQPDKTVYTNTVTLAQVNSEAYESTFVKVEDVVCSVLVNTYGEWKVTKNSTDSTNVDDLLLPSGAFSSITIDLGAWYDISGVVYYSYSEYAILPRNISEVIYLAVDEVAIENVSVYPNPVNSTLHIDNVADFNKITVSNVLGQTVKNYSKLNSNLEVDFSNLGEGVYFVSLYTEDSIVKTFKVIKK